MDIPEVISDGLIGKLYRPTLEVHPNFLAGMDFGVGCRMSMWIIFDNHLCVTST
jgi:hypothetical protein